MSSWPYESLTHGGRFGFGMHRLRTARLRNYLLGSPFSGHHPHTCSIPGSDKGGIDRSEDVHKAGFGIVTQVCVATELRDFPANFVFRRIMGPNVVSSRGEDWRRQRKITAPAFDGQMYVVMTHLARNLRIHDYGATATSTFGAQPVAFTTS